ncbi:MAG: GNAT family N-acetyltransferase [FCB group bacterium]|nr:GNAT family N-acetyltransferase [FCB group bacterium]
MNLWRSINGFPVYWVAEEDEKILAFSPGIEFGSSVWRRFQAMPDGCYSRIVFSETVNNRELLAKMIGDEIARFGYMKIFIYDFDHYFEEVSNYKYKPCETLLVDISGRDWFPPDKKIQSEIRKAQRENIVIQTFDPQLHFDQFMILMKQTEKRHRRSPKYPQKFFQALAELLLNDKRLVWYWCEYDEKPVSSHINIIEGEMVINWQVYFDKSFSFLKANQYLLYHLAKEMSAKGIKYLNLGASPPDASGLKIYKSKWGGKPYHYNCYFRFSLLLGKLF